MAEGKTIMKIHMDAAKRIFAGAPLLEELNIDESILTQMPDGIMGSVRRLSIDVDDDPNKPISQQDR